MHHIARRLRRQQWWWRRWWRWRRRWRRGGGGGGGAPPIPPPVAPSGLIGLSGGYLYSIDLATGDPSRVTEPGFLGAPDVRALAYDPTTDVFYGADFVTTTLYRVDAVTGLPSVIGPLPANPTGLAFDENTSTLYATTLGDDLFAIDTDTAKGTKIGGYDPTFAAAVFGLAFDPIDNVLYGTDVNANTLVTLSTADATMTPIGATVLNNVQGLTYDRATRTLYGYSSDAGQLVTLNVATGAATPIGDPGYVPFGLAFDPITAEVIGSAFGADEIIAIDPASANATSIGATGGVFAPALAYNGTTQTLYGFDDDSNELVQIDLATGIVTIVGAVGFSNVHSLAIDSINDILYGIDDDTNQLITIDTTTGAGTAVGGAATPGIWLSLAYDTNTNLLYTVNGLNGSVWSIDPTTGDFTALGFSFAASDVSALAFDSATSTLYHVDNNTTDLIATDMPAGTSTTIGTVSIDGIVGLAFDPDDGTLIATDDERLHLYSINTATAAATTRGRAVGFLFASGIAYAPSSDTIYASATSFFDPNEGLLLSLDRATGTGSVIGKLGFDRVSYLTYDTGSDTLYGVDIAADRLLTIDTATGAATMVADTAMFGGGGFGGFAYSPTDDALYGLGAAALWSIDRTSATASFVVQYSTAVFSLAHDPATDTLYAIGNDETAGTRNIFSVDTAGNVTPVADNTAAYQDLAVVP